MNTESSATPEPPRGRRLALLSLGALGVVYGDIGTSPLYALRECFHGEYAVAVTPANVFGILSLVFWSLVLVDTSTGKDLARIQVDRRGHFSFQGKVGRPRRVQLRAERDGMTWMSEPLTVLHGECRWHERHSHHRKHKKHR